MLSPPVPLPAVKSGEGGSTRQALEVECTAIGQRTAALAHEAGNNAVEDAALVMQLERGMRQAREEARKGQQAAERQGKVSERRRESPLGD